MKKHYIHAVIFSGIMIAAGLLSCSDSESRIPAYLKTAKVIIDLGLPQNTATAGTSIIDKILRFFARDAVAQTAPATFESVLVRVTGPDFGPIERTFAGSASISMEVPAGDFRQFEVIAYVAAGDPSAATSFRGTGSASLPAGATVSVLVAMGLYETKLLVCDYFNNRRKLIQFNNPAELSTATLPFSLTAATPNTTFLESTPMVFTPYDVDFDSLGRIYVTSHTSGQGLNIYRLNNIYSSIPDTCIPIISNYGPTTYSLSAIAIDRVRNRLYFSIDSSLYIIDLNDPTRTVNPMIISGLSITSIRGMDVDPASGDVFLACSGFYAGYYYPYVARFAISPPMIIPDWQGTHKVSQRLANDMTVQSWDVMVKGPYVYVAQCASSSSWTYNDINRIIQFDIGLTIPYPANSLTKNPAVAGTPTGTNDFFFAPRRFVGTTNRGFLVIDDSDSNVGGNKLLGFLDVDGTGWKPFPVDGYNICQFYFC